MAGIWARIKAVCARIGKNPDEITLIGVTKYADVPAINEAVAHGLTHIAENKVQEARRKFPAVVEAGEPVIKHMIGHLQTNKARQALELFDFIQSVDSLKLATALEEQAAKLDKDIDVLLQVNTSGEKQKFGIEPDQLMNLVHHVLSLKHMRLKGLMTIAPLTDQKEIIRRCFRDLRVLHDEVNRLYADSSPLYMKYLSMGMTDDFEIALEEGSNMVRIGRAIFQ